MPSETTTACVSLLVFFRIRRGTFRYGIEDDASTISQTPTTHYTSTYVKLTIVTHLSFSERIAIANLSLYLTCSFIRTTCKILSYKKGLRNPSPNVSVVPIFAQGTGTERGGACGNVVAVVTKRCRPGCACQPTYIYRELCTQIQLPEGCN